MFDRDRLIARKSLRVIKVSLSIRSKCFGTCMLIRKRKFTEPSSLEVFSRIWLSLSLLHSLPVVADYGEELVSKNESVYGVATVILKYVSTNIDYKDPVRSCLEHPWNTHFVLHLLSPRPLKLTIDRLWRFAKEIGSQTQIIVCIDNVQSMKICNPSVPHKVLSVMH